MFQLDLMIVVPLLFAGACLLAGVGFLGGRRPSALPRWIALAAVVIQAGLLISMSSAGVFHGTRILGLKAGIGGAVWGLAIDGLSVPLVALTIFIGAAAIVASWDVSERPATHYALLLALQTAVTAVFLADSLVLFYVAWECVLIPMYFLIGGWGSNNRRHAATKYLIYLFAAGTFMLVGLILAVIESGGSGSIAAIAGNPNAIVTPQLVFWLFMITFLAKVPVVGLHTWLPDAHTEAPTAGSILLAGVLLKMGGYGILRIAIPFAPGAFIQARVALAILGVIGIVYGAAMALTQTDLKRLVAYSSVAHMGFVVLAIAAATTASFSAAMLAMVSHGFVAGLLFFLAGTLYGRSHTRELADFGGLGAAMPIWGLAFVFGSLASLGLPALSGFPGEFVTVVESFSALGPWTALATVGLVLGAAYNLRAIRETVQGPVGALGPWPDLGRRETALAAAFCIAILAVGLQPALVTRMSEQVFSALAVLVGGGA